MLIIILFSFLLIEEGKSQSIPLDFDKVRWLKGTWVNESNTGNIYESWSQVNNYELQGISYLIQGQDTIVKETIRLIIENDAMYYIPSVKSQNEGKPIRFVMTRLSDNQMMFENPEHDFPQVIYYRQESKDSLLAEIWATDEGKIHKISFPMKRVCF